MMVWWTVPAVRPGGSAESSESSSSTSERSMEWSEKEKRRGSSSQREQNGDGSGGAGCREPDREISFPGMSESSDLDSPKKGC